MGKFLEGLASAIPIVGPAIAGGINAHQSRKNVKDTIRAQKEMAEYQWSKTNEMWNQQNEYNTPQNQMSRFEEAGLNKNLIYGQGTAGNATTLPQYSQVRPDYSTRQSVAGQAGLSILDRYQDFVMKNAQIDNVRSQAEINSAEAMYRKALLSIRRNLESAKSQKAHYEADWMYQPEGQKTGQKGGNLLDYQAEARRLVAEQLKQDIRNKELAGDLRGMEKEWFDWMKGSGIVGQSIAPIMRILLNSNK